MAVSVVHVLEQGPMLRTLGGAALSLLAGRRGAGVAAPGPWVAADVPAPSDGLVRAFVGYAGGDPSAYRGLVPVHLFPQWGLPLASRALAGVPYPLVRVLNAGCRLEVRAPLPRGEADVVIAGGGDSTSNAEVKLPQPFVHAFAPLALTGEQTARIGICAAGGLGAAAVLEAVQ